MEYPMEGEGMHYEGNCIRPPSEAYSILLQVTLGCSHNKCAFCGTYKDKRFQIKDDKIILSDILFASKYMKRQDRVFLMDGDALIIPQKRLMWILDRIKEHLPWVKRVGAYANTKSIKMKSPEELKELLSRLILRNPSTSDPRLLDVLGELRQQIDVYDDHLLDLIEQRMKVAETIGKYKKENNITILQSTRWDEIMNKVMPRGIAKGLSREMIDTIFKAIHQESINHQMKIMNNGLRIESVKK